MGKFIRVTTEQNHKLLLNTDTISMVDVCEDSPNQAYIIFRDQDDLRVKESFETIEAMLTLDPAVADIVRKGNEHDTTTTA